jgi:YHS domain-containing protein
MLSRLAFLSFLLSISLGTLVGCGNGTPGESTKDTKSSASAAAASDDVSGLKELDAADRKLAEKQKVCPVSGEKLGSMGKPFKMTLQNRTFFLCCDGCEETVKKEPEKYLKKVDELLGKK